MSISTALSGQFIQHKSIKLSPGDGCIGTSKGASAELHVFQKVFHSCHTHEAFRLRKESCFLQEKRETFSVCHSILHVFNTAHFQSYFTSECPMKIDKKNGAKIPHEDTP